MTTYLVANDTKPILTMTIKDSTGTAVNIAGCTITFHFVNKNTGAQVNDGVGEDACTILVAADGTCKYEWNATDLATPGEYIGEVKVVFADASIQTVYGILYFHVRGDLG
jgi:hypothetical protein